MRTYLLFMLLVVLALPIVFANAVQASRPARHVVSSTASIGADTGSQLGAASSTPTTRMPDIDPSLLVSPIALPKVEGTNVDRSGIYEMQISASGVITISSRVDPVAIRYTFTQSADTLIITPIDGLSGCTYTGPLAAAYHVTLHDDTLVLSPIDDRIICRRFDLSSSQWTRKRIWLV